MLYTPLVKKVLKLCFEAHDGQLDKAGIPYVNHPLHLAEQMDSEDEVCVALLHDVMEDCGKTPDDLRAIGVPERAIGALTLLTHDKDVPYLDYVRKVASDEVARKVKVADLRHNCDLSRLDAVGEGDLARLRKYLEARVVLGDMAYELETPAGPLSLEADGSPYPFSVNRVTAGHPACGGPGDPGGAPGAAGGVPAFPDETFLLEADILPLAEGDRLAVRLDVGAGAATWSSDGRTRRRVCETGGYAISAGFPIAGRGPEGPRPFEPVDGEAAYEVTEDPREYRYRPEAHTAGFLISWQRA